MGVHFGTYFGNFGACWAFGPPFGTLGFHSGVHGTLLDHFWAILGLILDLFWVFFGDMLGSFLRPRFRLRFGTLGGSFGHVLGPGGALKSMKNVER